MLLALALPEHDVRVSNGEQLQRFLVVGGLAIAIPGFLAF